MPEPLQRKQRGYDILSWVRTLQLRHIIVGLGILVILGVLFGAIADCLGWTFGKDIAANFVPDLFVAGLALLAAEVVFKFRETQEQRAVEERRLREHRAEEARKVIEAQRKAYPVVIREMYDNQETLDKILGKLQGGRMPPKDTTLKTKNWELLVQSPLVLHLSVELVWTLHEAYYESQTMLERLMFEMSHTGPQTYHRLAEKLRPDAEEELTRTRNAIEMLEGAQPRP